jgi:hypothetical protein
MIKYGQPRFLLLVTLFISLVIHFIRSNSFTLSDLIILTTLFLLILICIVVRMIGKSGDSKKPTSPADSGSLH